MPWTRCDQRRPQITFALSRHFSDLVEADREVRSLLPGHSGKEEEFSGS
jgi:hypothetical protein